MRGQEVELVQLEKLLRRVVRAGEEADGFAVEMRELTPHAGGEFALDDCGGKHPPEHEVDLRVGDDAGITLMPDALRERAQRGDVGVGGGGEVENGIHLN